MPLRITASIPIKPQSPTLPTLPGILGNIDAATPIRLLTIDPLEQEKKEWCWAACVQMVKTKLEDPLEQCAILERVLNKQVGECCDHKDNFKDEGMAVTKIRQAWKRCNVKATSHLGTAAVGDERGRIKFKDVKTEILADRPIEVGIEWFEGNGGGHALLIKGFGQIGNEPIVWINDPMRSTSHFKTSGEGPILFSELKNANNYGAWICTWTGLEKANV